VKVSISKMIYAYAVFRPFGGAIASWPCALAQSSPVEIISVAKSIQVIVSEVPAGLFDPAAVSHGTSSAEDPVWLAAAALAHHEIVIEAHRCGDVLPLRFGMVFLTREDLLRQFAIHEREWLLRLQRIAGREECEIRLLVDALQVEESRIEGRSQEWASLPAGRRYLAERAARRQVQEQLADLEQMAWQRFEFSLGDLFSASVERPNGSRVYLVERNCKTFLAFVEKFHVVEDGLAFEVAGIWPPYSFSGGDLEAGQDLSEFGQSGQVLSSPGARSDSFEAHSL